MIYGLGIRKKILSIIDEGEKISQVAKMYRLSRNTIYRWRKKIQIKGNLQDDKPKRGHRKLDPRKLMEYVRANNEMMKKDYAKHFSVISPAITYAFIKLKITRKKRRIIIGKEKKKVESYIWSI